ncbi:MULTISPECIES: MAPEG family protein [unclassified Pseudomonas]|uniref:MAPEG family protein n=1 Tax=unclassified Pseudomonas TaxID=196821 RepID=UPI002AC9ECAE|nr:MULTISPECIES: MAPEG family protein [unclassified Pseudomonas]MEB0040331.1 MAPEG family protein [Pseudomonas sp. MH10]MEB0077382.1 MAPEG family protein [Pseudomonas sp. MH10out]MEB0092838.1 MAPEG family protein [Pseudomonas sp. CCI4.2]MEB0101163.1 MAPEG family protein [Pseudomonas sp. CCI3.2]MEB0120560.1 MAPEG family protein [Pseudomonas sp. CCI1.2]
MTVAFWCVFIAIFLPYLCTGVAKFSGGQFGARQNHDPRAFLENLQGFAKRADSAQRNSFEVTPAFAAAVIISQYVGHAQMVTINVLAVLFITSRLLYIICYLADWAPLRSLFWAIGMGIVAALFFISA